MERNLLSRAAEFINAQRRKKRWTKAVSAMAAVVVFCTTYALILPAITMETEALCGQEAHTHSDACYTVETVTPQPTMLCSLETLREAGLHEHTEDCYDDGGELICGFADFVVHEHDDLCYDGDGTCICTLDEIEEHQHDADCYRTERTLTCDRQESSGHSHGDACYEAVRGDLLCTSEEEGHEHTDGCYQWSKELVCTRDETQGHRHTADCYDTERVLDCDKPEVILHEHDEDCYEENPDDPDGEPILVCGRTEVREHQHDQSCRQVVEGQEQQVLVCGLAEHTHAEACYLEEPEPAQDTEPENTQEGPVDDGVMPAYTCGLDEHTHDDVCYDEAGELSCGLEEHVHDESCTAENSFVEKPAPDIEEPRTAEFNIENDGLMIDLTVTGVLRIPDGADHQTSQVSPEEGAVQGDPWAKVELQANELEENTETFDRILDFAREHGGNDALYDIRAMEFHFLYEGVELDTSDWEIMAEVTLTSQMMTPPAVNPYAASEEPAADRNTQEVDVPQPMAVMNARTMVAETPPEETASGAAPETDAGPSTPIQAEVGEVAPEAEVGVVVSLFQETEEEVTQLDSVLLQEGEETPALRVTMQSNVLAVTMSSTANPKFTVQYYAYLDVAATMGSNPLTIIDTSGKKLPQNGSDPDTKELYLTQASNGKYQVATEEKLCEVYADRSCEYIKNPNLAYFNSLYENGNYVLKEIWILKEGCEETSTDQADWTVYGPGIHFTNRTASVNNTTVLVTDETVIRLVFDTTSAEYTNAANFYDYDITDDGVHTAAHGINTASNYTLGTVGGAKLAFGNDNTGTGLSKLRWNGNQLNMYNSQAKGSAVDGYKGCTFGLTTGLRDGKLQYASEVTAPMLFNEGNTQGKTSYDNGQYSLQFDRIGDTYTLSAVNGAGLAELQYFSHPGYGTVSHTHIWTNHFWPMDGVANVDPHTGKNGALGQYVGSSGTQKNYPISDDGLAHNNMFGMHYAVQFTLTEDYSGPLEYYFFGDDDMWVFLDGRLVCDIGGVHSSVGEYVNLWDYIQKGTPGTHTLTFFYTERGLSGSTCYMQFTLPSVSSITPEQNTGVLRVEKTVDGPDTGDKEFRFDIKFTDQNGKNLPDDYSYTRYAKDGTIVKQDVIIFDGGSFELKADEFVEINYLPIGTQYTITEQAEDGYSTTVSVNHGAITAGATATGTIQLGKQNTVAYVNKTSYELPATGGMGAHWYTFGGLLLMAGAGSLLYRKTRDGREAQ